jgi:hypothetical protein
MSLGLQSDVVHSAWKMPMIRWVRWLRRYLICPDTLDRTGNIRMHMYPSISSRIGQRVPPSHGFPLIFVKIHPQIRTSLRKAVSQ